MRSKAKSIPVNSIPDEPMTGIAIEKITFDNLHAFEEAGRSHRHDFHFFLLQEKGTATIEIDFEKYKLKKSVVLYIHPNQVHKMMKVENTAVYILAITNENLHPQYLNFLDNIAPAHPLLLNSEDFAILNKTVSLCININARKQSKLHSSIVKDSCNTLVALIISLYSDHTKPAGQTSRFDIIAKGFKLKLEGNFTSMKRPADYATSLNISTPYLNECVRNATGFSVSHHIQQRNILEAKRWLYHSDKSVKEIATKLGYQDYAYFSRVFAKITGITASAFRHKNRD